VCRHIPDDQRLHRFFFVTIADWYFVLIIFKNTFKNVKAKEGGKWLLFQDNPGPKKLEGENGSCSLSHSTNICWTHAVS
jgi:hypothetical protein